MHANCLYFVVNSCGVTQPAVRKEVAAAIIKAVTSVKSAEITPDKVRVVLQRNVTLHCAGARSVHACFFVRCLWTSLFHDQVLLFKLSYTLPHFKVVVRFGEAVDGFPLPAGHTHENVFDPAK